MVISDDDNQSSQEASSVSVWTTACNSMEESDQGFKMTPQEIQDERQKQMGRDRRAMNSSKSDEGLVLDRKKSGAYHGSGAAQDAGKKDKEGTTIRYSNLSYQGKDNQYNEDITSYWQKEFDRNSIMNSEDSTNPLVKDSIVCHRFDSNEQASTLQKSMTSSQKHGNNRSIQENKIPSTSSTKH